MKRSIRLGALGLVLAALAAPLGRAQESEGAGAGAPGVVVLDTSGFWRMYHTIALPVIRFDDGLKPAEPGGAEIDGWKKLLADPTAPPPQGWTAPDFDDGAWFRGTGGAVCRTPYLERVCLRGRFVVTEPARVKGLALSVDFYGGAVVYVNGKEIARKHVPPGALAAGALADDYPLEAFVDANGIPISLRGLEGLLSKDVPPETLQRLARRTRSIQAAIPAEALRKGVNVVAIEIFRAPYHKVLDNFKVKQSYKSTALTHDLSWNTCDLRRVQVTAPAAEGLVPNASRPEGVQVWNSSPLATDFDMDFGDVGVAPGPIRLAGARNGVFSGKVVVGSTRPIRGLEAAAGDLVGPNGAKILAHQVRLRYALPWGVCRTSNEGCFDATAYPADARPLSALAEGPLPEFPVIEKKMPGQRPSSTDPRAIVRSGLEVFFLNTPGQPAPVSGAVVPVWVTVEVPKLAKPGEYKGLVKIQVEGKNVAEVPLELKVADWAVPDPADFCTWVDMVQSPDVLALEYNVPLWDDKHFELIAKSMRFLKEAGNRNLYVPLIAHTNLGNEESMVRWVKKGANRYEHDFTVLEKYLDVALRSMGKPKVVCFNVWDLYTYQAGGKAVAYVGSEVSKATSQRGERGPQVTAVDPATGKRETVALPTYADPASPALWKPLLDGVRKRMQQRGLEGAMMLGEITDAWVSKEQVQFFQGIGADLPWVSASHGRHDGNRSLYDIAGVGYQAHAFGVDVAYVGSLRGWSRPGVNTLYERWGGFPFTMNTRWRAFPEYAVTGNTRGIGRVGADFWKAVRDKTGQRSGLAWQRYPEASWRQLSLITSVLAPGPEAAVATPQFEAIREGVQDAEARIQIEKALADPAASAKLGPELLQRCKNTLEERHKALWISVATLQDGPAAEHAFAAWRGCYYAGVTGYRWFLSSGWQERSLKLYNLAGDVERKLAQR
jgi:hypothetical protein